MSMYRITDKNGRTFCFQVASDERDAVATAKNYGNSGARHAERVGAAS